MYPDTTNVNNEWVGVSDTFTQTDVHTVMPERLPNIWIVSEYRLLHTFVAVLQRTKIPAQNSSAINV